MIQELLTQSQKELKVEITASEISSFRTKEITKSEARVFADGKVTSASYVGEIEDSKLYDRCLDQRDAAVPYDYDLPENSKYSESLIGPGPSCAEKLHEFTESALSRLKQANDRFLYSGGSASSIIRESLRNSKAVDLSIEYESVEWWVAFKHKSSANIMDGGFEFRTLEQPDVAEFIERNLPFLDAFENEVPLSPGPKVVVFNHAEGLSLLAKLSESLRIDKYKDNSALYSGKMGEQLFNEQLDLYDVNFSPQHGIASPFDGEGTLRNQPRLPLIERGVIKNLICDLRYAKKYGAASTGNGSRSFDSGARLAFNHLSIGRGSESWSQLLGQFDECIFVGMAGGGDFVDNGDFSSPVQLAFLIKDGKVMGRLPQMTVKSSLQEMFGPKLMAISKDGFLKSDLNPCVFIEMEVLLN